MPKPRMPTQEELNLMVKHLEVVGGNLICKVPYGRGRGHVNKGRVLGSNSHGYLVFSFYGRFYKVHRVVYFLRTGSWPKEQIDHINGDRADNRPENLREVSNMENSRSFNRSRAGATSKFRGVYHHKARSRWKASIMEYGVLFYIGFYTCEKEAALAYNYKAMELGFNKEAFNDVF